MNIVCDGCGTKLVKELDGETNIIIHDYLGNGTVRSLSLCYKCNEDFKKVTLDAICMSVWSDERMMKYLKNSVGNNNFCLSQKFLNTFGKLIDLLEK